jgi:hypothetical protein
MTHLRLIPSLVKIPKFHGIYLQKYNKLEPKHFTIGTLICLLSNLQISLSEASEKKFYSENFKVTCLKKKNPMIDPLIPNIMNQMLKIPIYIISSDHVHRCELRAPLQYR